MARNERNSSKKFYELMDRRRFREAYEYLLDHPKVLDSMTVSELSDFCCYFRPTSDLDPYSKQRVADPNLTGLKELLEKRVFEEGENLVRSG